MASTDANAAWTTDNTFTVDNSAYTTDGLSSVYVVVDPGVTAPVARPVPAFTRTPGIVQRLKSLIPSGWFSRDNAPVGDAILGGIGDSSSWLIGRRDYAASQTRVQTASGFWLDLVAWDFFGPRLMRREAEADDAFRSRILAELLRPRNTRAAISRALFDLTGIAPELREPWNPGDNGGWGRRMAWGGSATLAVRVSGWNSPRSRYGRGTFAFAVPSAAKGGSAGAGHYGSMAMRNQILVRARRGSGGILNVGASGAYGNGRLSWGGNRPSPPEFLGWNAKRAGWSNPRLGWLRYSPPYAVSKGHGFYTNSIAQGRASDAEIYGAVNATRAAGVIAWVNIAP